MSEPAEPVTKRQPPPFVGGPVSLPDLRRKSCSGPEPAPDSSRNAAGVHTHAYTRGEARPEREDRRPTRRHAQSLLPPRLAGSFWAAEFARLLLAQPPSLSSAWQQHTASARWLRGSQPAAEAGGDGQYLMGADGGIHYVQTGRRSGSLWRWLAMLGLCWGAVHVVVGAVIFTFLEATFHPLRALLLAALIVLLAFHPW